METTQRTSMTAATNKLTVPFYAPPPYMKKTSAEIISEARASVIRENEEIRIESTRMAASIRPVNTKRPFTPRERERTLFGGAHKSGCRPPSSFSLGYLQFQEGRVLSAQSFGTPTFLSPEDISKATNKFRLPSIDSAGKPSRRHQFRATASLDNLPEEIEVDESESEESGGNSISSRELPPPRKAYSSPVQRTRSIDTEMELSTVNKKLLLNSTSKDTLVSEKIPSQSNSQMKNDISKMVLTTDKNVVSGLNDSISTAKFKNSSQESKPLNQNIKPELSQQNLKYDSKAQKEDSKESDQKSSNNTNPVKTNLHVVSSTENKSVSRYKKKPNQEKGKHTTYAEKENLNQEPLLKDNAFGPELNIKDAKKKTEPVKMDSEKQKLHSTVLEEYQTSKSEKHMKQKAPRNNHVLTDNWTSENNKTDSKIKKSTTSEQKLTKHEDISNSDNMNNETKIKRSHQQTKPTLETAEKNVSVRKKPKSEIKEMIVNKEENKDSVHFILSILNSLADKEECSAGITITCFIKHSMTCKLRSQVLKNTCYKFVEQSSDEKLLLFRVSGNNLSGVCKLVFKVSRNDKNDKLFLEDNILALGSASPLEDAESCVYGYGALKFLTMNNTLLAKVLKLGILELMVLHMKMVNVARVEGSRIPEQTSHALFQLTGALRNVAGEEEMFPHFVSTGAVVELCKAMELFSSDLDVISNISRTLSIISTHDDCCTAIVDYENSFKLFVKLFQKYPGRQDIIVRLGYALGNLMASNDTARTKFFNEDGAVNSMLNLLDIYLDKDLHMLGSSEANSELTNSDAGSNGSVEDVMVKMIRILANMSINPMVGSSLACSSTSFYEDHIQNIDIQHRNVNGSDQNDKVGDKFLDVLLTVLRRKSVAESEELVHSVLSTLNNLSYYPTNNDGVFGERQLEIAQALSSLLNMENKDCLVEATRVYGNLTRSKDTRDFLLESGAWTKILKFLEYDDPELLCTTVGILVNMMADWDKRIALKEGHGIERLIKVLSKYGEVDWQLAALICQALWNYCIESTNLHAALGVEETSHLSAILVDFLDEERLFGVVEGSEVNEDLVSSEHYQMWEEFAGVAINLLEKMETFLDSLDSYESLEIINEPQNFGHLSFNHPASDYQVL
ncbi:hypothetical protein L9F63_023449 [Diploptera punctata]|uniref:Armadillo repeat-containing protein 2 n=1 Tax=Diploptera punctata TaxID=6984 RepID=A0AAD7ZIW4_DIPPU|nr:hypothetical protein L9F63_023449 [Diploptera punctata]